MILDIFHGVHVDGEQMPSVNEATDPSVSPANSMAELGNILPCIIYAVGTAPKSQGPVLFSKLDIKDGYWRMVVPKEDEWNFAYVLPKANPQDPDEPTVLVIPSSLQIGWTASPAFFCAASETARHSGHCRSTHWNHSCCRLKEPLSMQETHKMEWMRTHPMSATFADYWKHSSTISSTLRKRLTRNNYGTYPGACSTQSTRFSPRHQ
jgi:hypothetical protein